MRANESRPVQVAPEVIAATRTIVPQEGPFPLDDLVAAELEGYRLGWHARGEANAQERVAEILHEHACHWVAVARSQATERHGPAWAELVCGDHGE